MPFFVAFQSTTGILFVVATVWVAALTPSLCGAETQLPADGAENARVNTMNRLTMSEIHNLAWPVARRHYNTKFVQETKDKPIHTEPLPENAYLRPTAIFFRAQGLEVLYGGNKAGPTIRVYLNESGSVSKVTASHASK